MWAGLKGKGTKKKKLIDHSLVITREKVGKGEVEYGKGEIIVMEGGLTWGGEHTVQYTDDIL